MPDPELRQFVSNMVAWLLCVFLRCAAILLLLDASLAVGARVRIGLEIDLLISALIAAGAAVWNVQERPNGVTPQAPSLLNTAARTFPLAVIWAIMLWCMMILSPADAPPVRSVFESPRPQGALYDLLRGNNR